MDWLAALGTQALVVFVLVLARISGMVITAPVYNAPETPLQVRALLAVALALIIAPSQMHLGATMPSSVLALVGLSVGELLIGLTLGLGVAVLFAGIQVAGQVIAQMSGMALAESYNPGFDASLPLFSHFLTLFTMVIFLVIGGHRMLMAGLLDSFTVLPLGHPAFPGSIGETMATLLTQSFTLGIRVAAPATIALLLANLVLGLISRTLPQLNILAIGFGVNAVVTLVTMATSLAALVWIFQDHFDAAAHLVWDAWQTPGWSSLQ